MPDSLNLQFRPAPRTDLSAIVRMLANDEFGARRECFETSLPQAQVASVRLLER